MRRAAARLVASHYGHRTGDHGAREAPAFLRRHNLAVHADALWQYEPAIRAWTVVYPLTEGAPSWPPRRRDT
jgi:hypothetical protein